MTDFTVSGGGTVYQLRLHTVAAREWVDDNLPLEPWQWFGDAIAVEHRYIGDIVQGIQADGLTVEEEK